MSAVVPGRPEAAPPTASHGAPARRWTTAAAVVGALAAGAAGLAVRPPTVWGLLPIVLYAVLALAGTPMARATGAALVAALLMARPTPGELLSLGLHSLADQVALIGLVALLGTALGEVLAATGAAGALVGAVLRPLAGRGPRVLPLAVWGTCLVLVFALGTLAGALAVAAPLVVPVAARAGLTRSTTAAAMFLGGCSGLALAPFAGSNVAVLDAAGTSYGGYLLVGALPLTAVSLAVARVALPLIQRRTDRRPDEHYPVPPAPASSAHAAPAPSAPASSPGGGRERWAATAFATALGVCVVGAAVTRTGALFPLAALPLMAAATALGGGLRPGAAARRFAVGARRGLPTLVLFLALAAFFRAVELLRPYDVLMERFGGHAAQLPPLGFAVVVALLGWLAVPGATAAHVVLLHKVFGPLGDSLGLSPAAWTVTYLWGSKADTYGPFPNPNMLAAHGFAGARRLRVLVLLGWSVLLPAAAVYFLLLTVLT
ncbi:permease [Kitasatospora phosalacinea]|uniref:Permease n=1 Tax=Kitasatospora phosalacinea TaxID=2065 RepID=A0A9W6V4M2_9ACTN|nr:Na+/H+ antiporter NhaC family protein [Kitasatospora phosalacinea]GLW73428.1 permease [Kitasatospora phosalacinea]